MLTMRLDLTENEVATLLFCLGAVVGMATLRDCPAISKTVFQLADKLAQAQRREE